MPAEELTAPGTPVREPPPATPEPEPVASNLDQFSQPGKWMSPFSDKQLQRLLSGDVHGEDGHLCDASNGGWTTAGADDGAWRPMPAPPTPPPRSWRPTSAVTVTEKNRNIATTSLQNSRAHEVARPRSARPASAHGPGANGISWGYSRPSTGFSPRSSLSSAHAASSHNTSLGSRTSSARRASEHPGSALLSLRSANRHTMMSPYAQSALGQMISACGLDREGMLLNGRSQSPDAFHIHAQQQYEKKYGSSRRTSLGTWN